MYFLSIIICISRVRRLELKLMRAKRLVWPVFGELKVQILDVLKFENELAHLTRIDLRLRKMILVVRVANSNRVTQPIWPKIYRFSWFLIWPHFYLSQNFRKLSDGIRRTLRVLFGKKNISDPTSNDTHTTPHLQSGLICTRHGPDMVFVIAEVYFKVKSHRGNGNLWSRKLKFSVSWSHKYWAVPYILFRPSTD